MTEASGGAGVSRAEMERKLIQRSLEDEGFRRRLLEDPRRPWRRSWGHGCPRSVKVRVVEETADTIYLVLPSASALGDQGGELSDEALEAVAGGLSSWNESCQTQLCGTIMWESEPD